MITRFARLALENCDFSFDATTPHVMYAIKHTLCELVADLVFLIASANYYTNHNGANVFQLKPFQLTSKWNHNIPNSIESENHQ